MLARQAAINLVGGEVDEVSRIELLLGDIRDIFTELKDNKITSADLIVKLCEIVPRPWAEFGRSGKPITQNRLARLLKGVGVAKRKATWRVELLFSHPLAQVLRQRGRHRAPHDWTSRCP